MTSLLLANANVHAMDPERPNATAVAVLDGRIIAVGTEQDAGNALSGPFERIDCEGGAFLPGFIDAHCHLFAYAAALRSVDCTDASSIADAQWAIRKRAATIPPGEWIRAFGYEETALAEKRHPDRHDLDRVAPDHPVRLIHRSGHASVLNTVGLRRAGITTTTEEPTGGRMERELPGGEPDGVLLDMESVLDCAIPSPSYIELREAVREASERMLRYGVTAITDASHTNGREQWELFERLIGDGAIAQGVVMMEGLGHFGELPESAADGRLRRGAVKVMLHELGDEVEPDKDELSRTVADVHNAGRQVAIHAVGERAVGVGASAIEAAVCARPRDDHRHRIEHCALLPDGLAARLASCNIVVVSQPSFLRERGERYLELVPEAQHSRLYAFGALAAAGVTLAAGSDSPVTHPEPLASVANAVERRTRSGTQIAPEQAVEAGEALRWWTSGAAYTSFLEGERGKLRAGLAADVVLLERDPLACGPHELRSLQVRQVWLAGEPEMDR